MHVPRLKMTQPDLELFFNGEDDFPNQRVDRQNLARLVPFNRGSVDASTYVRRMGLELGICRHRSARKRDDIRIHSHFTSCQKPLVGLAYCFCQVTQTAARRRENEIEEWRDAEIQRFLQHRVNMLEDLRFVELLEDAQREVLHAKTEHAESGPPHCCESLGIHRVDAIGADELQMLRQLAVRLRGDDRLAKRQD